MIVLKIILWISTIFCLSSCSEKNSSPTATLAERIFSQKDCPVLLHPQKQDIAPPKYSWHPHPNSVLTSYSFLCHGQGSFVNSSEGSIYDCDGLNHSLTNESFLIINPKLIEISRFLQKHFPNLSILEGLCCPRHFRFLEAAGTPVSPKHLSGNAAVLLIPQPSSMESISNILKKFLRSQIDPLKISDTMLENSEYRLILNSEPQGTKVLLEILYS